MIFIFCSSMFFALSYYAFKYLKQTAKPLEYKSDRCIKRKTSDDNFEMSDDEFCDPSGASRRWEQNQANQDQSTSSSGLFSWKRERQVNPSDNSMKNSEKKRKLDVYIEETESEEEAIIISDDDSDTNNAEKVIEQRSDSDCIAISDFPIKTCDSVDKAPPKKAFGIFRPSKKNSNFVSDNTSKKSIFSTLNEIKGILKSKQEIPCENKIQEKKENGIDKKGIEEKPCPAPTSNELLINATPVKFPVTPYSSQIAVMNAIIRGCSRGEHCLLESPTGSGKTLALLCAALAWQKRFK
ncbi:hypothetical protein QAD02_014893, partial [Eretmocerus hayati]